MRKMTFTFITVATMLLLSAPIKSAPSCFNPECTLKIPTQYTPEYKKEHLLKELNATECDLSQVQVEELIKLAVAKESSVADAEQVIELIRVKSSDKKVFLQSIKKIEATVTSYSKKRTINELISEI